MENMSCQSSHISNRYLVYFSYSLKQTHKKYYYRSNNVKKFCQERNKLTSYHIKYEMDNKIKISNIFSY